MKILSIESEHILATAVTAMKSHQFRSKRTHQRRSKEWRPQAHNGGQKRTSNIDSDTTEHELG
jgi:hypothetical protein